jgi:LmbE family N-acetylglucosaminyl deacetylase
MSTLRRMAGDAVRKLMGPHRRAYGFMQSAFSFDLPAETCEPRNETIVVLAPHMDDEVIGCGGTIARHVRAGARVTVVYLSDNRYVKANAHLPRAERERLHLELLVTRKREARDGCAVLGVDDLHFLDGDPRGLGDSEEVAARLRALLQAVSPAIVYVPVFLDRHPDHRASNAVLQRAVQGTNLDFECRAYEVWTPLVPNRLVRIDDVLELKLQALACHASQLAHTDFLHMIRGLNAYRASAVPDGAARFAEAFLALPLPEYLGLYRRFSSRE